ncbi:MAG: PEP-CTERM sorting domain-containing protein [Mariniblastus sp.]|nr:PEP-CTERM sorting domain-containing protein [Mariniblastus sp.]
MLRNRTKTFTGLVTLACTAALLSLPTESVGQDGHFDNSVDSYNKVIEGIQYNWADMRGGWNDQQNGNYLTLSQPLERSHGGKTQVLMQYNFNAGDKIFGVGGTHSVLISTGNAGGQPSLPQGGLAPIKDPSEYHANGTVPVGTPDGVNAGSTPWLSKAGELRTYLEHRSTEWELEKNPFQDGSVFQRAAQVSGMGYDTGLKHQDFGYHNNYIVEMWVDKDAIFRPNLHQSVDITQAGSFEASLHLPSGKYVPDTTNPPGNDAWLPGLNGQLYNQNNDGGPEYAFFDQYAGNATDAVGFYNTWWTASFEKEKKGRWFGGITPNAFPWTGIGYTYDWYYQNLDANGDLLMSWEDYWDMDGNNDDYTYGQGLAEYVLLQSNEDGKDPINFEITNVQTTYQYMGGKNGMWGTVPEPTTLTIFGMAALAGLGMHRRRRR